MNTGEIQINGVNITKQMIEGGRYYVQRRTFGRAGVYAVVCRYTGDVVAKDMRQKDAIDLMHDMNKDFKSWVKTYGKA